MSEPAERCHNLNEKLKVSYFLFKWVALHLSTWLCEYLSNYILRREPVTLISVCDGIWCQLKTHSHSADTNVINMCLL